MSMSLGNYGVMVGAMVGIKAGEFLYEMDKEANKYMEVPIPFYTAKKAAKNISDGACKIYSDIVSKIKKESDEPSEAEAPVEDANIHIVTDEEMAEELNCPQPESQVIETEIIDGKAVPVNEQQQPVQPDEENNGEAQIPKFTIIDNDNGKGESTKEATDESAQQADPKPNHDHATVKGSKNKATSKSSK